MRVRSRSRLPVRQYKESRGQKFARGILTLVDAIVTAEIVECFRRYALKEAVCTICGSHIFCTNGLKPAFEQRDYLRFGLRVFGVEVDVKLREKSVLPCHEQRPDDEVVDFLEDD